MKGIRVDKPGNKPYLVTGHKMYMIGSQDGLFPERGEHLPYQMWGVWAPPVKVLNGLWLKVNGELAEKAVSYEQLPYGGIFQYEGKDWSMERFQFIPQEEKSLLIRVSLHNSTEKDKTYELSLGLQSNLMPVWLAERAGIEDGADSVVFEPETGRLFLVEDKNPWTAVVSSDMGWSLKEDAKIPVERRENPLDCYCEAAGTVRLAAGESKEVNFYLAFSEHSKEEAVKTLLKLEEKKEVFLQAKQSFYEELDKTAVLTLPGKPVWEEMYRWTKYINDWIVRDVDGIGKGVVAGYAEFPWWFGNDTNYIVPALLMQGDYESCKSTLRLVKERSIAYNGNGRVVHEISSNGQVYYEGMTTETPQFADTVWAVYQWSGDKAFLEEMYDFCVQGMDWIEGMCEEGLPRGYGITEIAGLDCFCCDVALLVIRGFEILSQMSKVLGKEEAAVNYAKKQQESWDIFQKEFYLPEYGIYGDMAAYKDEIISRAETWKYTLRSFPITEEEEIMGESSCKKDKSPEDAAEKARLKKRMEGVVEEAKKMRDGERKAFYLFGGHHSTIAMELGYLKGEAGAAVFDALEKLHQKDNAAVENKMPIGGGRENMAFANIGNLQGILNNIEWIAEGFSKVMPGATNEIYPEMGCFVQAWNSLSTMWPYANGMFGIRPEANRKEITLEPCLGEAVNGLTLTNLKIGGESFDFAYERVGEKDIIRVKRPSGEWKVLLAENAKQVTLIVED